MCFENTGSLQATGKLDAAAFALGVKHSSRCGRSTQWITARLSSPKKGIASLLIQSWTRYGLSG